MSINLKTKFTIFKHIADKEMDDVLYLLNPHKGHLHTLNETAETIWLCLKKNMSFGEILNIVTSEYNIDRKTAKKDVESFFKMLIKSGVIKEFI